MTEPHPPNDQPSLEREKWLADVTFREREIALKEKTHDVTLAELRLKQAEQAASRWKSPLVVAIFAAAIAGASNALLSYLSSESQVKLESQKSEQLRILEMIKTGDPDKAAENLRFLLEAGLIRDASLRRDLHDYLNKRKPGVGPSLPTTGFTPKDASQLLSRFEGTFLRPYRDSTGQLYIGSGHRLTDTEMARGTIQIDGEEIPFVNGLTEDQAKRLLEQDLRPVRLQIERLVVVPLSAEQKEALVAFAWNVGIRNFERSSLLRKLNEGRYEEVPKEMRRWVRAGGIEVPGLVARREAEASLWKKPTQ
jgi:GH24 family phage-related lysozyme (muramidase)